MPDRLRGSSIRHTILLCPAATLLVLDTIWFSTFSNTIWNDSGRSDALDCRIEHESEFHLSVDWPGT